MIPSAVETQRIKKLLCRTNFIGRDRNMLCQDLFDNCYEKFLFGIFNLGTLYQRKFMSVSFPHNL